ncbi:MULTISPECIES: DUF2975 domain-containing protein [Kordiimonas]|uniref:DUF2975 domain-containing protein n=1 Tax=Kordiimonas lacus TaxID=637679 RepID=A0A1G7ASB0_9PROT|nr:MULTISPECIES: DUF2975 domain-containing protein [Kordiimonas]SDE17622.1 Protein of unknown function [Kordiimonas lacus]
MNNKLLSLTLLKWIIWFSITLIITFNVWIWVDPSALSHLGAEKRLIDNYGGISGMVLWQRIAGFVVDALPAGLLIAALASLIGLIRQLEAGNWFAEASERALARVGHLMLWYLLASFLNDTLLVLIATATNPPGERALAISLSSDTVLGLVPALMALVIARMVRLAREQRDELNQIV